MTHSNAILVAAERGVEDRDPRHRLAVVRGLSRLGGEGEAVRGRAVDLLGRLVADEAEYVRWNVAVALGRLADPRGLRHLRTLAADEHANVRFRVALAVGLIGDPDGLDILIGLREDSYQLGGSFPVPAYVALALGLLGEPRGLEALTALAGHSNGEVRWHATVALGDLSDEQGVEALIARTEDEISFVRAHAAIALSEVGSPNGLEAVERLATSDPVDRVRNIAGNALKALREGLVQ